MRPKDQPLRFHILFPFQDGPYGGANQFLKALQKALAAQGHYAEKPEEANVFLFNSHHDLRRVRDMRLKRPDALFIHRVDGPMRGYNQDNDDRDKKVYRASRLLADATVFQSEWSRQENLRYGFPQGTPSTVIGNAPDETIFYPGKRTKPEVGKPARLLATSWSPNPNKGFDVYRYLDETLDPEHYHLTFVGNAPEPFRNIRMIPPQSSPALAEIMRDHDLFISASRKEAFSNSIVEALFCGLPVISFAGSSAREAVPEGAGEFYEQKEEIPGKIDNILNNYQAYTAANTPTTIKNISEFYKHFAASALSHCQDKNAIKNLYRYLGLRIYSAFNYF